MFNLDTPISDAEISVRLSNFLYTKGIKIIRDFLNIELHSYLGIRNIGHKTLKEISDLYGNLKEQLGGEWEGEQTGTIYWKSQKDFYCYGVLLKDGTVILAIQITKKGFGWVDIDIETNPMGDQFLPFGKRPVTFNGCRDTISVRSEFIGAICDCAS